MSEIPEAEIMKAKAWYEQDLRPRMKTGEGKSIPELLAEYGRHIAAEKDKEIERLRAENDRLQKMMEPKWFYPGPEYDSEGCYFSEGDVVQVVLDWDGRPGEVRVIEIARATPLPSVWACAKVLTDEEKLAREDDGDFVFTLHDSEEAAEAKKAALEGEKGDG